MSALTDLQAAFVTEIATISDTLLKAKATYVLERLVAAWAKHAALESSQIQSYSIAGRTVTRRNLDEGRAVLDQLEGELRQLIYGNVTLADMNQNATEA